MAEDVLEKCQESGLLPTLKDSSTAHHRLVGAPAPGGTTTPISQPPGLHQYGMEADLVAQLPGSAVMVAPHLSEAMVRFAARHEYARTVEDILARRCRLLFLDACAAGDAAPAVAAVLANELGHAVPVDDFLALARRYSSLP
jgi:glycerol-3-phosphate dehydrogenase